MAFFVFDEATNEMLGVVRFHSVSIYETRDYAILLRSDLKGQSTRVGLNAIDHRIR